MIKILLDSQHLVPFKSVLDRKKIKIIPEGATLCLQGNEGDDMVGFLSD
jgi:hypothetical protein